MVHSVSLAQWTKHTEVPAHWNVQSPSQVNSQDTSPEQVPDESGPTAAVQPAVPPQVTSQFAPHCRLQAVVPWQATEQLSTQLT